MINLKVYSFFKAFLKNFTSLHVFYSSVKYFCSDNSSLNQIRNTSDFFYGKMLQKFEDSRFCAQIFSETFSVLLC